MDVRSSFGRRSPGVERSARPGGAGWDLRWRWRPAAYIPPCPGAGYVWVAGYWANGYWVPGYWNFVGVGPRVVVRGGFGRDRGPAFYRHDFDRHNRDDRHFDRDDHFRR